MAIFSRVIAALIGGYLLTNIVAIMLAHLLPFCASDAVMTAILISFLVYTAAILWSFSANTVRKVWAGLLIPTLTGTVIIGLLQPESWL